MSRKISINREDMSKRSPFSYTVFVVARKMMFISVVTPPSNYYGFSTQKTFWEDNFTPVNMKSCGRHNVRKHREIDNGEQNITLELFWVLDCLEKREVTHSGSRDYVRGLDKGLTNSLTLRIKRM